VIIALLILHGLVGVALLGAITHQMVSVFRRRAVRSGSFFDRYTGVNQRVFTTAVVALYVTNVLLGATIYPSYRLDVRIPFDWLWKPEIADSHRNGRIAISLIIASIVWWDFLVGHVLNNLRGLG
jgi:hypothetical protein